MALEQRISMTARWVPWRICKSLWLSGATIGAMLTHIWALAAVLAFSGVFVSSEAATLDEVKARGFVQCGVSKGKPGFSHRDEKGVWRGLDVDLCRALAAAIFSDATRLVLVPLSARERFVALQAGEIEILSRHTAWTASRDNELRLNFAATNYYDGQGFLVRSSLGVERAEQLRDFRFCELSGLTSTQMAKSYFASLKLEYSTMPFANRERLVAGYENGLCDVISEDQSDLYILKARLARPTAHQVLPDLIAIEPLGPLVREHDDSWLNLVRWAFFCMVVAEELGVTSANAAQMVVADDARIRRLLGVSGDYGESLGVAADVIRERC